MQIEKVDSTLNGDPIKCGHFNSSMYDSYIEFPVNLDTGKKYTIHGYIKSSVVGQISCEGVTSDVSTEWSHVVMTITPSQQKSLELKFNPGEFWIYEWKLEVGEVNSNWTPSPLDAKYDLISLGSEVQQLSDSIIQKVWKEDISDATKEINKSMTTIGQNAEKIYWLIDKNSENQASMSLTSDLYKLVAENINLAGKVTFESFSSAMQENWNGLSNTVNNSISKVTTEYYKSTSSEEPLDGKWSEASPLWEEGYYIWSRTVSTNLNGDNEVSEPVCITGNKGSDGVGISSIISQYYLSSSFTELKDGSWIDNESPTWVKGKYIWTRSKIIWNNGNVTTTTAVLAKALNTANENAVAAWNTTQDIIKNIYVTNKTTIDGGRIETGTVTADAIATDAIVSKNYVKDSAGSFLNLADGSFDSKYLKWDSTGAITATNVNITNGKIQTSGTAKGNDGITYLMQCVISGGQILMKNLTNNNSKLFIQGHGIWLDNSLGNNILQLSGSEEGGAYIGLRSGKGNNEIVVQMGTNRQTTDDGSIDYKGYINIPNCAHLGRENTFSTKTWFDNTVYVNDNSNLQIWHNSRKKYGKPVTYMNNPVSIDWDGSVLKIYIDDTIVASWIWGEQRWE